MTTVRHRQARHPTGMSRGLRPRSLFIFSNFLLACAPTFRPLPGDGTGQGGRGRRGCPRPRRSNWDGCCGGSDAARAAQFPSQFVARRNMIFPSIQPSIRPTPVNRWPQTAAGHDPVASASSPRKDVHANNNKRDRFRCIHSRELVYVPYNHLNACIYKKWSA